MGTVACYPRIASSTTPHVYVASKAYFIIAPKVMVGNLAPTTPAGAARRRGPRDGVVWAPSRSCCRVCSVIGLCRAVNEPWKRVTRGTPEEGAGVGLRRLPPKKDCWTRVLRTSERTGSV